MSRQLIALLRARKNSIQQEIETALNHGADLRALQKLEQTLQCMEVLEKLNSAPSRPLWIAPIFVLAIAVTAIGLAATIHINQPRMLVDVQTRSFGFTVGREGSGLISDKNILVKSISIVGNNNAHNALVKATSISSIKFDPGAQAIIEKTKDCLNVQLLQPTVAGAGASITAVLETTVAGTLPPTEQLDLKSGTHFAICGEFDTDFFIVGALEKLELSRTLESEAIEGKIRIASIQKGSLLIPVVNKLVELKDTDQLFLTDIARGWVFIKIYPEMRVEFSGNVGMARSAGLVKGRPGDGATMVPTVLEWATKSSFITGMFGILTGLIGMIWSSAKYFGYRSP